MKNLIKGILVILVILIITFALSKALEGSLNNISDSNNHLSKQEDLEVSEAQNSGGTNIQAVEPPKTEENIVETPTEPAEEPINGDEVAIGNAPSFDEEVNNMPAPTNEQWTYNCLTGATLLDNPGLNASHRTLPIGTVLRVYNSQDASKFVDVTIVSRNADSYTRCLSITPEAMNQLAPEGTIAIYSYFKIN